MMQCCELLQIKFYRCFGTRSIRCCRWLAAEEANAWICRWFWLLSYRWR